MIYSVMPYVRRRDAYRVLVEKPQGKRVLGRHGIDGRIFRKWAGDSDWIDLGQNKDRWLAYVNVVMNLRVPYNAGNFLTR
jgi:hypothetical protein